MTKINQENGTLEFDGYVRCSESEDADFTVGKLYRANSLTGVQDNDEYNYGGCEQKIWGESLLANRIPLSVVNRYMNVMGYSFDEFLQSEQKAIQTQPDTSDSRAKSTYYELLKILSVLEQANPLMSEDQLIEQTGWVVESVIDKIISLMGYPKSDFVFGVILDAIRDYDNFNSIRNKIEDGDFSEDEVVVERLVANGYIWEGDE